MTLPPTGADDETDNDTNDEHGDDGAPMGYSVKLQWRGHSYATRAVPRVAGTPWRNGLGDPKEGTLNVWRVGEQQQLYSHVRRHCNIHWLLVL